MPTNDKTPDLAIRKVARIEDKATGTFLEVIEFPVSATKCRRITLPPSTVNSPGPFKKALLDAGAILPKNDQELQGLLRRVAKSDAPRQWIYEDHVGWIRNGQAYVTVNGVIGDVPAKIIGINRSNSVKEPSGRLSTSGTSEAWRDGVAKPARNSSILMLAICIALAAPLLYFVKRRSFTINIFGQTRTGKTIATLLGASILGIGRVLDLITWRITDARLEQRLSEYNDAMFPIDDLETMREKEGKEKYLRIRNLAYNLEQGWAMGRHDLFTLGHGGVREQWRCIAVTSCEKSIRDLAQSVRLDRQPGETLRLIDVPALFHGLDHIFDRLPSDFETDDFQKWKEATFSEITEACEQNHGTPFRKYILALIADGPELKKYISENVDYFLKYVRDDGDGDVARDVAQKFGLFYVGGLLGIRCGLLPWNCSELLDAIAKCYLGARALLPDDGVLLREGIKALRETIRKLPSLFDLQRTPSAMAGLGDLDGYWTGRKGTDPCLIKCEVFNAIFTSPHQRDLVLRWLLRKNRITTAVARTSDKGTEPVLKGQIDWADGKRRRSYELRWASES